MVQLVRPALNRIASSRIASSRVARAAVLVAALFGLAGFESADRLDAKVIKPLPRTFRMVVVEGPLTPGEARYRRSGNTYVNEAPNANGSSLLTASWFAVHPTDAEAILLEYPATDSLGRTVYRIEYALEEDRNRYRLYHLDEARFSAALNTLESAVRRGDAGRRDRRAYAALTRIWNANVQSHTEAPSSSFHVSGIDDVNELIAYSRRLDDGEKIITSTGDVIELYIR